MGEPGLPVTGTVGIPVTITGQPALKNPQEIKNRLIKRLLGRNRPAVAHHIAATKQPIQKVNTVFGLIVTRDQAVMVGQHARISLGKKPFGKKASENKSSRNDRPTSNERPSQEGRQTSEATPSRGKKKPIGDKPILNKRPNFGDKPSRRMPGSDKPKSGTSRRPAVPKKRSNRKSNASPQGGQGTLKRRR